VAEADNNSPDLTHARIVKLGDNLPLMVANIYLHPTTYYLQVAEANDLNNFRRLRTGQQLIFPPVKKGNS
jgi:nucleoid-associated protein YgaU